jgi:hypothetical protein
MLAVLFAGHQSCRGIIIQSTLVVVPLTGQLPCAAATTGPCSDTVVALGWLTVANGGTAAITIVFGMFISYADVGRPDWILGSVELVTVNLVIPDELPLKLVSVPEYV